MVYLHIVVWRCLHSETDGIDVWMNFSLPGIKTAQYWVHIFLRRWNIRKMAARSGRLICQNDTHKPIDLPDQEPIIIGRSLETRIADKKVSRHQLKLVADCNKKKVTVTQLGSNSCTIATKELKKGESAALEEGVVLNILSGSYPHKVVFPESETDKSTTNSRIEKGDKMSKRNIGDYFSKESAKSSKRPAECNSLEKESQLKKRRTDNEDVLSEEDDEDEHAQTVMNRLMKMKENFQKDTPKLAAGDSEKAPVPEQKGKPATEASWTEQKGIIVYTAVGSFPSSKIAAFDIDGCIITTKSGKVFAQNTSDWKINFPEIKGRLRKLVSDGYKLAFFTNQMGIARGKLKVGDYKGKVTGIISQLDLPIQVFIASGPGMFRKPCLGMWEFLLNYKNDGIAVDTSKSFYVGDAAGRPVNWAPKKKKDFACSDRLFALNAGLTFHTPEEYFLGYKKAAFTMPEFDPRCVDKTSELLSPSSAKLTSGGKEIILTVGLPGSGKSHFSRTHLLPKGYVHVTRDALGSWQKCVEKAKTALNQGNSVVVDNTNVDLDSRKRYLDVGRSLKVPCRCFWFDVSFNQCRHNERFRQVTDKSHQPINEMIFNQLKSKFKAPDLSEGFAEIVKVNFLPKFKDITEEKFYKQFLVEK